MSDKSFLLMLPKFGKFLVLYLGCGCMIFNFTTQMTLHYLLSGKTTKYILKYWERSVKRKSNFSFIRVIKIHLLINVFCIYMVKTFLKILYFGDDFYLSVQNISLLAVQLYRIRHKLFWLFPCLVYYNTYSFCLRGFSLRYALTDGLLSSLIKVLSVQLSITSSFWTFIVPCFSLILLLPNFFRRII